MTGACWSADGAQCLSFSLVRDYPRIRWRATDTFNLSFAHRKGGTKLEGLLHKVFPNLYAALCQDLIFRRIHVDVATCCVSASDDSPSGPAQEVSLLSILVFL